MVKVNDKFTQESSGIVMTWRSLTQEEIDEGYAQIAAGMSEDEVIDGLVAKIQAEVDAFNRAAGSKP